MPIWLRRTLIALAAVVALVAVAAAWLVASFDGERSKRLAIDWMREHHQRELTIDGPVRLTLLPVGMAVSKLRLSEHQRPKDTFATAESAELSLRLWPLLTERRLAIDHVSARGVRAVYLRDAQGRRNIDDLVGGRDAAPAPRSDTDADSDAKRGIGIDAERIAISDVQLTVRDALAGIDGRFDIEQLTSGRLAAGATSPLSFAGRVLLNEPKVDARATLEARIGLAMAPGQAVKLRLDDARLALAGRGAGFEALDARLEAAALSYDGAANALAAERARLTLSGSRAGVTFKDSTLAFDRLAFDPQRRALALEKLAARLTGRIGADAFDARIGWPALQVSGERLQGGPLGGDIRLDGATRKLQLALSSQPPAGSFERIDVPGLKLRITGEFNGQRVQGELASRLALKPEPWAVALDGAQLAVTFSAPTPAPLQLRAEGTLNADAQRAAARLAGTFNEQRFELQADAALGGARARVDAKARFDGLDLTRFVAARSPAPAASGAAPADAPVDLSALKAFDGRLELRAGKLVYPPYRIDDAQFVATVRDGVLDVTRLAGRSWGGQFAGTARADANTRRLGLDFNADNVDLRALLSDVARYERLEGRGRLNARLQTGGASVSQLRTALDGRAAFSVRDGALRGINLAKTLRQWRSAIALTRAGGQDARQTGNNEERTDFTELSASFDIANGIARSKDLVAKSPFLRVGGEGSIDLVRSRIDYLARATVTGTDQGQGGPELAMLKGMTVPIELSGPLASVDYRVRWSAVSAELVARAAPAVIGGRAGEALRGIVPGAAPPAASGASAPAKSPEQQLKERARERLKDLLGK
ncbi:AsmA family protein [Caldimonas sp. KR1-144]|uniref:AsmA family protein n=1 Tax=Caldimonas sp. KR1-144 TaxID=3400911 RepID=UPI003C0214E6